MSPWLEESDIIIHCIYIYIYIYIYICNYVCGIDILQHHAVIWFNSSEVTSSIVGKQMLLHNILFKYIICIISVLVGTCCLLYLKHIWKYLVSASTVSFLSYLPVYIIFVIISKSSIEHALVPNRKIKLNYAWNISYLWVCMTSHPIFMFTVRN